MLDNFRFPLGAHALLRSAQRHVPVKAIEPVLLFGDWHWQPRRSGKLRRCEVTLSRHHIPPDEPADLQRYAGATVIFAEFGDIVTVMKRRSRESSVRRPYVRERWHWRQYLQRSPLD